MILNAEIKFRRYFEMIRQNPPGGPSPDDVLALMHRTMELVDLLYWKPEPTPGSIGEAIRLRTLEHRRSNVPRDARRPPIVDSDSSEEVEMEPPEVFPGYGTSGQLYGSYGFGSESRP